jgi:tetratricopeptide (TPR) repeat protein
MPQIKLARRLTLVSVIFSLLLGKTYSQPATRFFSEHQYTRVIETLLGARRDFSGINDQDLFWLGGAYMKRGFFLRELAALQDRLGRDYYFYRDTSKAVQPIPWTPYFLGRHLFEQGQFEPALRYFQRVARTANLPNHYSDRGRIWAGACQYLIAQKTEANNSWAAVATSDDHGRASELAYARWRAGARSEEKLSVAPASNKNAADGRYQLWFAARRGQIPDLLKLQETLLANLTADAEYPLEGNYALRFYDPAGVHIAAYANFVAAMEAFSRVQPTYKNADRAVYFSGVCAVQSGEYERARLYLQKTGAPQRDIYLGVLDYMSGQRDRAEQQWRRLLTANPGFEPEWAEAVSRFAEKQAEILTLYKKKTKKDKTDYNMETIWRWGRTLVQSRQYEEAFKLMDEFYPRRFHNQVSQIEPAYLITFAHVKYSLGRRYVSDILGHIECLVAPYPITLVALEMAQVLLAPENPAGKKRSGK